MSQLQQAMEQAPMAVNFAIFCCTYRKQPEGGAGYYFDLSLDERERRPNGFEYKDQQGNPSTNKAVAKVMGLSQTRLSDLYKKYDSDWQYIYDNFGNTKIRTTRYNRVWLNHNNEESNVPEIAEHYQCDPSTVYRAFAAFDGDAVRAHKQLNLLKGKS